MSANIPAAFEKILQCLDQEKDASISWTLSRSHNGQFSLKFWTLPENKVGAKKSRDRFVNSSKHDVPSSPISNVNVDISPDSVGPEILEKPKSTGRKRRQKPPSKVNRDRRRQAIWRLRQQLSREIRQASDRLLENQPDCLPDKYLQGVLENPAAPELNELCKDATESVAVGPNDIPFKEAAEKVVGSPNNSKSSVTNCVVECDDTSVLDFEDERVDTTTPLLKEAPEWCVECGKAEGKLFIGCSKCKAVKYCGAKCQMENWTEHKTNCAFLKGMIGK